ncbi:hypothetical protein U1Q18_036496 [Sarracenia purpurea var. burkii]
MGRVWPSWDGLWWRGKETSFLGLGKATVALVRAQAHNDSIIGFWGGDSGIARERQTWEAVMDGNGTTSGGDALWQWQLVLGLVGVAAMSEGGGANDKNSTCGSITTEKKNIWRFSYNDLKFGNAWNPMFDKKREDNGFDTGFTGVSGNGRSSQ